MLSWFFSLLTTPFLSKIVDYLTTRSNTELGKYKGDIEVATAAVQAEIASRRAAADVLIAEQGRWYTAIMRPIMALPLGLYLWKVVVWDKIVCAFYPACVAGSTDPITGNVGEWMGLIIISYFGASASVDIATRIVGALRRR